MIGITLKEQELSKFISFLHKHDLTINQLKEHKYPNSYGKITYVIFNPNNKQIPIPNYFSKISLEELKCYLLRKKN